MNAVLLRICLLAGLSFSLTSAFAQEDAREAERRAELERQEVFRAGFQDIVTDLNGNSLERFANAIDRDDMLDRIFGLRLIDQRVKLADQLGLCLSLCFAQGGTVITYVLANSLSCIRIIGPEFSLKVYHQLISSVEVEAIIRLYLSPFDIPWI